VAVGWSWNAAINGTRYQLQVDDDSRFRSPEVDVEVNGLNHTTTALNDGRYYWRVRAINSIQIAGAWSASRYFIVDAAPPLPPVLSSPTPDGVVTSARPTLRWNASASAVRYQVQVSDQPDFSTLLADVELVGRLYSLAVSLPPGDYYWQVRARDTAGRWGDYSPPRGFMVNIQRTPGDGRYTTDTTPLLQWYAWAGAVRYQVEVSASSSFSSPLVQYQTASGTIYSYTLPAALPYGIYYWRVNVDTGAGFVPSPDAWQLTITPTPPAAPSLVELANGASTGDETPELRWLPSTGGAGSTFTYQLQVDDDPGFRSPEVDVVVNGLNHTTTALNDGRYYWRVRTVNNMQVFGAWSSTRYFNMDSPAAILD
jgi:predicted phage tail protein